MSHRAEEKQARREERERAEQDARRIEARLRMRRRAGYGGVGAIGTTLVILAIALGGNTSESPAPAADGSAPTVGAIAPAFSLTDAVTGATVSRDSLKGSKTMLFFSEGINCQACMVQAADLEKAGTLSSEGINLVSVTTDPADQLAEAARQYGITTPLLADPTTAMSAAYGMLGHGGMGHPNTAGHAFMLLDEKGRVLWHRAYQEMYVKPKQLISDMRTETTA